VSTPPGRRTDATESTSAPPRREGRAAVTYVGHATVLIELAGMRLLTDPLLGEGILHVRRRVPTPAIGDLRPLDAILISHAHRDHLDHRSMRLLAGCCPVIAPRGCASAVRRGGVREVIEVDEGGRVAIGEVVVEVAHATHDGRRHPLSRPMAAVGYMLQGPMNIYFAGDTDLFAGMHDLAGRVDVALLPIWGWGSRVGAGHLDPGRAAEAVARIRPDIAVPIHWGTLRAWGAQRGLDPLSPARAFADAVRASSPRTEVRILRPGQRAGLEGRGRPHDPADNRVGEQAAILESRISPSDDDRGATSTLRPQRRSG
jgi:L-ascorbate metabolism protein UlaG (beta-lactamase superfamily)